MKPKPRFFQSKIWQILLPLLLLIIILALWQSAVSFSLVSSYILPSPAQIISAFFKDFPLLMAHTKTTITETLIGFLLGASFGFFWAYLMDRFSLFTAASYPFIVASQSVPSIALAPLLIVWFGYGIAPKIILVTITTFFPVCIGLFHGLKQVDDDSVSFLYTMNASSFQTFRFIKFSWALPSLFSGLKISASYAIVSAVVAEWLGGQSGLGVYMTKVRKSFAYDKIFCAAIIVIILSLLFVKCLSVIEKKSMPWKYRR